MKSIIEKFYRNFENLDAESMVECYHKEIVFEDPAFGVLKGEKAKNMWRMLCSSQKGKGFKIKASNIEFENQKGKLIGKHFIFLAKPVGKYITSLMLSLNLRMEKSLNILTNLICTDGRDKHWVSKGFCWDGLLFLRKN